MSKTIYDHIWRDIYGLPTYISRHDCSKVTSILSKCLWLCQMEGRKEDTVNLGNIILYLTTWCLIDPCTLVPAQLNITSGDTKNLREGDNITLICVADGIPRPTIIWFFKETIINLKPRVEIIPTYQRAFRPDVQLVPGNNTIISSLIVINVDREADGGRYVCQASNTIGSPQLLQQPFILNITESMITDYSYTCTCLKFEQCFTCLNK